MSTTGEHILDGVRLEGSPHHGYVAKTNRGWAALPDGRGNGEEREFLGFRTAQAAWGALRKIRQRDDRLSERSVSEVFDAGPLYRISIEDSTPSEAREFTVTVAGPERHDGEKPYTYVVSATSKQEAWVEALTTHMQEQETIDCFVVEAMSSEGAPPKSAGYHWRDLRSQV
ncbi:hypothetical protein ACFWAP_00865 [Streptomyces goshikiensis]|uniref:hypothetical protein n=1 Tax=Streptomyces goshikiensis TaxID=1942 RepID=UPI00364FB4CE